MCLSWRTSSQTWGCFIWVGSIAYCTLPCWIESAYWIDLWFISCAVHFTDSLDALHPMPPYGILEPTRQYDDGSARDDGGRQWISMWSFLLGTSNVAIHGSIHVWTGQVIRSEVSRTEAKCLIIFYCSCSASQPWIHSYTVWTCSWCLAWPLIVPGDGSDEAAGEWQFHPHRTRVHLQTR